MSGPDQIRYSFKGIDHDHASVQPERDLLREDYRHWKAAEEIAFGALFLVIVLFAIVGYLTD